VLEQAVVQQTMEPTEAAAQWRSFAAIAPPLADALSSAWIDRSWIKLS
jgi:hypothetical protein